MEHPLDKASRLVVEKHVFEGRADARRGVEARDVVVGGDVAIGRRGRGGQRSRHDECV